MGILQWILMLVGICICNGEATEDEVKAANGYLEQFGWLGTDKSQGLQETMEDAIKSFQEFAGLPVNGELDEATIELMNTPRCGVRDNPERIEQGDHLRKKRYILQGSRWKVRNVTYRLNNYPSNMEKSKDKVKVMNDIRKAFLAWSKVSNINFHEISDPDLKVHIDMSFERGEHGDGDPFDGPGKTLAHAYFPIYGGDVHFDDSEIWTVNTHGGTNLLQVAAHELGHSLGLSHSETQSSLMAPFYRGYDPDFELDIDDIQAIQALYGEKKLVETSTAKPTVPIGPSICKDPKIDAITRVADEMDCVFKGAYYWKLLGDGIAEGYPRKIADDFPGVPNDIDAAVSVKEETYFFKGDEFWLFTYYTPDSKNPRKISDYFIGIEDNIDAAFIWSGNNAMYFFKGDQYWKNMSYASSKYPRKISNWGLPNNIDGALQYDSNGKTYFFKGDNYWRFHDKDFKIAKSTRNPYPRRFSEWWLGCQLSAIIQEMESPQNDQNQQIESAPDNSTSSSDK